MKMSLLDMVQDILNDMDSDAVNAITDTEEALQVAQIIKTTYFEMLSLKEQPHLKTIGQLESVSDSERPNYLKVPENVGKIEFIIYNRRRPNNTRDYWKDMHYLYPDEFMVRMMNRNSDDTRITVVTDISGARLNIKNDIAPEFYTSFDDEYVVFDSWDKFVEPTVLGTQSNVHFLRIPAWKHENNFVPDLPIKHFPHLLAEAKSVASLKLKEEADDKAEQQAERQRKRLSLDGWTVNKGMRYPDYGRRSAKAPQSRRPRIFGERT